MRTPAPVTGFVMQDPNSGRVSSQQMPKEIPGVGDMQVFKPEDMAYFGKLTDGTSEEALSVEELKERKIMRLLLKVKHGTPPMRKTALPEAHEVGPGRSTPLCEATDFASGRIDRTEEYDDRIATPRASHKQRGTSFKPELWAGSARLDLLKPSITCDQISATMFERRKLATRLSQDATGRSAAGVAYALKSAFLKYLAACEILTIHEKELSRPKSSSTSRPRATSPYTYLENYTPKKRPTNGLGDVE
ncbi:hypothetical protein MAPG_03514 [Magnaporthiopsis poae ATCC 64411]|uniref:Uncharacterized protein n=1 Tax=Magnaporthiopsis poae (strain ATCC 64411 / 73-15) TaxID=644358 RepID=A0A0C4DU76_MAGP6|nr:hypothetical protein MAPG_03514 [Magnaporthiopsis poae ATCC 64411]